MKMVNSPIKTTDNTKNANIEEALSILDAETKRRVEDVRQRIEFMCASLRAQGNTQINKLLKAIRELTVEDFCEKYGADTQYFMSQQTMQRISQTKNKRPSVNDSEKFDATIKKRSKVLKIDAEKEIEPGSDASSHTHTGPVIVRLERDLQPTISIQLNPGHSVEGLGKLSIDAPIDMLKELNEVERGRIREQIQSIQDELENLKKIVS